MNFVSIDVEESRTVSEAEERLRKNKIYDSMLGMSRKLVNPGAAIEGSICDF